MAAKRGRSPEPELRDEKKHQGLIQDLRVVEEDITDHRLVTKKNKEEMNVPWSRINGPTDVEPLKYLSSKQKSRIRFLGITMETEIYFAENGHKLNIEDICRIGWVEKNIGFDHTSECYTFQHEDIFLLVATTMEKDIKYWCFFIGD